MKKYRKYYYYVIFFQIILDYIFTQYQISIGFFEGNKIYSFIPLEIGLILSLLYMFLFYKFGKRIFWVLLYNVWFLFINVIHIIQILSV